MQAESFYQSHDHHAVPLCLISTSQWQKDTIELSSRERNQLDNQQFQAKLGELSLIYDGKGQLAKAFIGQGEASDVQVIAYAALQLPGGCYIVNQELSDVALVFWGLAQYAFGRYKKQEKKPRVLVIDEKKLASTLAEVDAIFLTRDLINTPPNDMDPEQLAQASFALAQQFQAEFKQWVGDELLTDNFPAIHAVGRASVSAPRLLELNWGDKKHPLVTLIGKGVCFDSGGINLKPASAMRLMKKDMGGAAQVLGLAHWIMATRLAIRLQVLIPAVENTIDNNAIRPGDVLTMRNGLTVEIDNTDAEGRLVLADAITKACEQKPSLIINFATLTGAARVAVGTEIAAMFTQDDQLAHDLAVISSQIQDPIWRLPLYAGYEYLVESPVANLCNCHATPYAGAIAAGLFLQHFFPKETPWVHFDIMAWNLSSKPGRPEGGEAMGLRTMARYLVQQFGID